MSRHLKRVLPVSARLVAVLVLFGLACLAGLLHSVQSLAAAEQDTYTFAVVPQYPPAAIKRDWGPFIERVSRDAGVALKLQFYKSIPDFEQEIHEGIPDFVYLNPYHAVMAKKAQGYIPLVRDGENQLVGIIVVDKDSDFTSVEDLNGKTIVFPSPNAFAASLYMRALLTTQEKIKFTPKYVITHSNVYKHVLAGMAAAGGGVNKTLENAPQELRDELRIIYRTPPVVSHPIAVHPRVPLSVRKAVVNALLKLNEDAGADGLLKAVGIEKIVRAYYERDYGPIERLGLEKYVVKGGD